MWIGLAMRGERIVHAAAWCEDPFAPSVIRCCSSLRLVSRNGVKVFERLKSRGSLVGEWALEPPPPLAPLSLVIPDQ